MNAELAQSYMAQARKTGFPSPTRFNHPLEIPVCTAQVYRNGHPVPESGLNRLPIQCFERSSPIRNILVPSHMHAAPRGIEHLEQ